MRTQNERAPTAGTVRGAEKSAGERTFRDEDSTAHHHATHASADVLLHRLDGVQRAGTGWRARCPACGGKSRKVSITESGDRVLIHAFCGCPAIDVLAAIGLTWADLHPPRTWPMSREEQRHARRAIKESGWSAALAVLALEARIALLAATDVHTLGGLQSGADLDRLAQAVERIGSASTVLCDAAREVSA